MSFLQFVSDRSEVHRVLDDVKVVLGGEGAIQDRHNKRERRDESERVED